MSNDVLKIVQSVVAEYPAGFFHFVPVSSPSPSFSSDMIVFGSSPKGSFPKAIRTYSYAQLATKANAVTALRAALNHFYLPEKIRPSSTIVYPNWQLGFDLDLPIAVDIETSGNLDTDTPEEVGILSIAFYQYNPAEHDPHVWGLFDLRAIGTSASEPAMTRYIVDFLSKIKYGIFHNGKFDIRVIESRLGIRMSNWFDTMLAHHTLNMAANLHSLKPLCRMYLGAPEWEADLSKYTVGGAFYEKVPAVILNNYNLWDVYWTFQLFEYLEPQIMADEESMKAFLLEMNASEFLMEVEQFGFAIDMGYTSALEVQMTQDLQASYNRLQSGVGAFVYNPNSWQQTQKIISAITGQIYTGSTNEGSLLKLKVSAPNSGLIQFIDELLHYRSLAKALSTYVKGALKNERKGRVHTTFKIHGTSTGRLSSAGPNIQNIPRDKKYRSIYIG